MLEVAFAVPGDLNTPTGGYAYARKLLERLPQEGLALRAVALPAAYPHPTDADLAETERLLSPLRPAAFLIDGLAYGAMPVGLLQKLTIPMVALVHHPLAFESGLSPARQRELFASEAAALALARKVIATSATTARLLVSDFGVPRETIATAEPGTEPARRASGTGSPLALLAVGALSPRKGYEILVAALKDLADLDWRLTIAGSLERAPETVRALRAAVAEGGLGGRIHLVGAVSEDALDELYERADVFVSASLFEGYGMVLAEALARGLPLVASTGGAAAETMPDGAGLKVRPGDVAALREALRRMITDPALRRACADRSWAAGQALPRWSDTARAVAATIREAAR